MEQVLVVAPWVFAALGVGTGWLASKASQRRQGRRSTARRQALIFARVRATYR